MVLSEGSVMTIKGGCGCWEVDGVLGPGASVLALLLVIRVLFIHR